MTKPTVVKPLLLVLLALPLALIAAFEEFNQFTGSLAPATPGPQHRSINYYVQLVRGDDQDVPPRPGVRLVGPKLDHAMRSAFRMKSFWEIDRHQLSVPVGQQGRVALAGGRAVSIDLSEAGKRKVATFQDGALLERAIRPLGTQMTIIGGQDTFRDAWFVVVRRDEPTVQ